MTGPILVVDDEPLVRKMLARAVERTGAEVVTAADGEEGLTKFQELDSAVVFTDLRMPGMDGMAFLRSIKALAPDTPVVMFSAYTSDEMVEAARAAGAAHVLPKPFTHAELQQVLAIVRQSRPEVVAPPLVSATPQMDEILTLARRVARTDATVLIHGETGTGKELLARFIHRESARASRPFVAVNCAALPESLAESELFGHEKGAFTGAVGRRVGCFEAAAGGTLLLDEITEIPLGLQAKLLRSLQEGEVVRVGSSRPVSVDVRIIAVTNRDLRAEVAQGRFRQDLFYRLNVVAIRPPALRERVGDIAVLARHFLLKYAAMHLSRVQGFTPAAMETLLAHPWPGNVRELENTVQRAVILCPGTEVDAPDVQVESADFVEPVMTGGRTMTELQRDVILTTLDRMNGNRTHAARELGVTARTIRNHLRKYRLAAAASQA